MFYLFQSKDSAGSIGTSSVHSIDFESEISRVPQEVLSHLIKDCDYYEKKMAREAEFKKQRVFNTGNGVAKPVWTNANRVNHANQFVPRSVQLNAGRPNINSVRPNINAGRPNINSVRPNINTGRTNVNPVRPRVNTGSSNVNTVRSRQPVPVKTSNSFSPKRPQVNQFNQRGHFSKSYSSEESPMLQKTTTQMSHSYAVKGNWGSAVKTSAEVYLIVDAQRHKTGNKDQLRNIKEFNGDLFTTLEVAKATYLIKYDTEFKNRDMLEFCGNKGIKQEYSNARTPQQNEVAERMNMTLIEAARTMLADIILLLLPEEPKKISEALQRIQLVQAMSYKNKRDVRGVVGKISKIGAQGYTQEEEVYVSQTSWLCDPDHPKKVKGGQRLLYGLHQAPRAWEKKDIMLVQVPEYNDKAVSVQFSFQSLPKTFQHLNAVNKKSLSTIRANTFRAFSGGVQVDLGQSDLESSVGRASLQEVSQSVGLERVRSRLVGAVRSWTLTLAGWRLRRRRVYDMTMTAITMLPNNEIFEGMGNMGYPTDGSFTFWKSFFTPQWRFLVHHILHCISSKSGGWDQFGVNIALLDLCLSTGRVYNFSKLIFDGMVANLKSKTKFLMYPRFLQLILDIQTENKHPYLAVTLTKKIFGNMKRGFRGAPRPLLPAMLLVATTNPSAGQEHPDVAQSQPSSSTIPVPSTSLPPVQSPPPITTPIPASTPTPIPETDPEPMEHTFEEPSPAHQHFSPPQEHAQGQMTVDDLLQLVP
ncbi:uncharacterized mitochondrial protein-like protein [Tanacetum coccineum]